MADVSPGVVPPLEQDTTEITRKILVIGDCGVGKTSFVWRSSGGKFLGNNYKPTIGTNCVVKIVKKDFTIVRLVLWDIAGQDRVRALMKTYARGAAAVIIVCDVTDRKTLEGAREWKQLADETLVTRPPTILVANKYDLPDRVHQFSSGELETFTAGNNIDGYFQTSVKENINIEESLRALADLVISNSNGTMSSRGMHGSTLSLNFPSRKRTCCKS